MLRPFYTDGNDDLFSLIDLFLARSIKLDTCMSLRLIV